MGENKSMKYFSQWSKILIWLCRSSFAKEILIYLLLYDQQKVPKFNMHLQNIIANQSVCQWGLNYYERCQFPNFHVLVGLCLFCLCWLDLLSWKYGYLRLRAKSSCKLLFLKIDFVSKTSGRCCRPMISSTTISLCNKDWFPTLCVLVVMKKSMY